MSECESKCGCVYASESECRHGRECFLARACLGALAPGDGRIFSRIFF